MVFLGLQNKKHLRSKGQKNSKMYLKERVYWDTPLARVLRLDGRGEEGGQQNGNLTRERERVFQRQQDLYTAENGLHFQAYTSSLLLPLPREKELFTFSIDMES